MEDCANTKYKLLDTASLKIIFNRGLLGGKPSLIGWCVIQLMETLLAHCERQGVLRLERVWIPRHLQLPTHPRFHICSFCGPWNVVSFPGSLSFLLAVLHAFFVVCENHIYLLKYSFHIYPFSNDGGGFHYCLVSPASFPRSPLMFPPPFYLILFLAVSMI